MYLTGKDVRQKETFNLNWFFYLGEEEKTPGDKDTADYRPVTVSYTHLGVWFRGLSGGNHRTGSGNV